MKYSVFFMLLFMFSCKSSPKHDYLGAATKNVTTVKSRHNVNDTVYCGNLQKLNSPELRVIESSFILFNDSCSSVFSDLFGGGHLPEEYNFENIQGLQYTRKHDTIGLKILALNNLIKYQMCLDLIYFSADTVFFKQKFLGSDSTYRPWKNTFKESHIVFIIENGRKNFVIKQLGR